MAYKNCLNLPFNVIFVETYEDLPKEDNYLMKTLLLYLKVLHYFKLNVFTFVEFYPLAPSGVTRKTTSKFGHCSKNALWHVMPLFVDIVQHL
jgi:hypothetical protein